MERPALTHPLLKDNAGFPLELFQKQEKKLTLWSSGTRLATLAYFNGALFMRTGNHLQPLSTGLHNIPGVSGLAVDVGPKGLNFRVNERTVVGFEADYFNANDKRSWARIENESKGPVSGSRNTSRIAVVLALSGLAIAGAVLGRGCDAHAENQDAVSEE